MSIARDGSAFDSPGHAVIDLAEYAEARAELDTISCLTLAAVSRRHILEVLRLCGGNRTRAARVLGISYRGLHLRLNDLIARGIDVPAPRGGEAARA
jgi:DNA-binding NtrC family response regulator